MQATVNADDIIAAGKKRFKNAAGSFVAEQCKNADALFMESYITQVFGILPELVTRNANIARDTLTELVREAQKTGTENNFLDNAFPALCGIASQYDWMAARLIEDILPALVKGDAALEKRYLHEGLDLLPALTQAAPKTAHVMARQLLNIVGGEQYAPADRAEVFGLCMDTLPAVAEQDFWSGYKMARTLRAAAPTREDFIQKGFGVLPEMQQRAPGAAGGFADMLLLSTLRKEGSAKVFDAGCAEVFKRNARAICKKQPHEDLATVLVEDLARLKRREADTLFVVPQQEKAAPAAPVVKTPVSPQPQEAPAKKLVSQFRQQSRHAPNNLQPPPPPPAHIQAALERLKQNNVCY